MVAEAVARLSELEEAAPIQVEVDGLPVCLVRLGDEVKAIYDVCSHEEFALHEGYVWGRALECALHGSTFDLDTGEPESLPATTPVPVFTVEVDGDEVRVDVARQLNAAPIPVHD